MAEKNIFLTLEGFKKSEEELEYLKTKRRKEVAEQLKTAIAQGDLSENAEYDEAKNEQAKLEAEIIDLEEMLKVATIINESEITTDVVSVGCKVLVEDLEFNEEEEYVIVGSAEADPFEGRISNESPVGQALLGKEAGEIVDVKVPDGIIQYKILNIDK